MSCEICGKISCTTSFHSLDEQETFDRVKEKVKSRILTLLENKSIWLVDDNGKDVLAVTLEDIHNIL